VRGLGNRPFTEISPGQQLGPFGVKVTRDLARAFLMPILLTVSPPDFLNRSSENKQDVSCRFRNFDSFFLFNGFDDTICPGE
jgi:hypothetical protein